MADYKDILSGTFGRLADKVKETASSTGVLDVYAQGANRAKAFGQLTKLTLELNGEHEELQRISTEIGRMYYEQAKAAPEGPFAPLFDQAGRTTERIRVTRAKIDDLHAHYGEAGGRDIDVEIGDFDDIVSAAETDAMTFDFENKIPEE